MSHGLTHYIKLILILLSWVPTFPALTTFGLIINALTHSLPLPLTDRSQLAAVRPGSMVALTDHRSANRVSPFKWSESHRLLVQPARIAVPTPIPTVGAAIHTLIYPVGTAGRAPIHPTGTAGCRRWTLQALLIAADSHCWHFKNGPSKRSGRRRDSLRSSYGIRARC